MDKNSNIKATYVYANGQRVAKIKPDGTIIFYINDPLGSPLILMDGDGNIVKRYRFDPFGNLEAQWGSFDSLIDIQYRHLILYAKGG